MVSKNHPIRQWNKIKTIKNVVQRRIKLFKPLKGSNYRLKLTPFLHFSAPNRRMVLVSAIVNWVDELFDQDLLVSVKVNIVTCSSPLMRTHSERWLLRKNGFNVIVRDVCKKSTTTVQRTTVKIWILMLFAGLLNTIKSTCSFVKV